MDEAGGKLTLTAPEGGHPSGWEKLEPGTSSRGLFITMKVDDDRRAVIFL